MGLLSFVKDAGDKISGKSEEIEQLLTSKVENFNFNIENFNITVTNDKATVKGFVESQSIKERIGLIIGNTAGIGEVDNKMLVQDADETIDVAEAQVYTVVSGDTLGKIAKQFYNDAMKYTEILEANKPMLKDANSIFPGQVLRIPPLD